MTKADCKIRAVIYDVDGTMVNSEPLHVAAWQSALQAYGRKLTDLSEEFRARMAGKKPAAIAEGMVSELHLSISSDALLQKKTILFQEEANANLIGMPGIVESVRRLSESGYELAIGTSLDRAYIDFVLTRLRLVGAFRVIVTGDQIKNGKPHPETYLTVVAKLHRQPTECVVLEDAASGIQSAKAAGAWCIAVENKNAAPQDTSEADVVVHSLNDVTRDLISTLS